MPTNYATKQAAIKLQVSPNTLRNWSDQYADYLSESARPGHLPERQFTDRDMTVLEYIKQLRGEGMKESGIKQRLSETNFTDTEILQPTTNALQPEQPTTLPLAPGSHQDTPAAIMVVIDAMNTMQRRVESLETVVEQSRRNRVSDIVLGVLLALGFIVVILLLAVLYGK